MRTHLLRTVYPSPAIEAIEPETGCASNDDDYAPGPAPDSNQWQVRLTTLVAPAAAATTDDHDDYCLGGYAGI
ncbi:MAG: hypothetical protein ABI843_09610 [Dokdonella sp.]